jgi:hypothetical protein
MPPGIVLASRPANHPIAHHFLKKVNQNIPAFYVPARVFLGLFAGQVCSAAWISWRQLSMLDQVSNQKL